MVIGRNMTSMNQRETCSVSEYLMERLLFTLISAFGKQDTSIIDFAIDFASRIRTIGNSPGHITYADIFTRIFHSCTMPSKTSKTKPAKTKPAKTEPGIYISEKEKADIIKSTVEGNRDELRKALEKVASRSNEGGKSEASDAIYPGDVLEYIKLEKNGDAYRDLEDWLSRKYPGSEMLPPGLINLFAVACLCDDLRGNQLNITHITDQPQPVPGADHRTLRLRSQIRRRSLIIS
jgi:hypothetical protein